MSRNTKWVVNRLSLATAWQYVAFHRRMSLREVARQIGVTPSTLSRLDSGASIDSDALVSLVMWLGVPMSRVARLREECAPYFTDGGDSDKEWNAKIRAVADALEALTKERDEARAYLRERDTIIGALQDSRASVVEERDRIREAADALCSPLYNPDDGICAWCGSNRSQDHTSDCALDRYQKAQSPVKEP